MNDIIMAVIVAFVSGGFVAIIAWIRFRKKDIADTKQIAAHTANIDKSTEKLAAEAEAVQVTSRGAEVTYYQEVVDRLVTQVRKLEDRVSELKTDIAAAQEKYERRVGSLHEQLDRLATELKRANDQLETANKTIGELRQEVKDGNVIISELQEKITKLLIDKAKEEKKGD